MPAVVMILALLLLGDVNSALNADTASKPLDVEFLRGYLAGEYDLIGRKPDSATTYTGRVTIRDVGGTLQAFTRLQLEIGMIRPRKRVTPNVFPGYSIF